MRGLPEVEQGHRLKEEEGTVATSDHAAEILWPAPPSAAFFAASVSGVHRDWKTLIKAVFFPLNKGVEVVKMRF